MPDDDAERQSLAAETHGHQLPAVEQVQAETPPPKAGDTVEVLLETVEGEDGAIALSYRKAKRQKEWNAILEKHKEGDVVSGKVNPRAVPACDAGDRGARAKASRKR